jgi:hypothetical protein
LSIAALPCPEYTNKHKDLYSTKAGNKKIYPLPHALNDEDVTQILHDHSVLSQILWPHSSAIVRAEASNIPNLSKFTIGSENTSFKATLCSQSDGVTCVEELPIGFKITITYTTASRDQVAIEQSRYSDETEIASSSSSLHSTTLPLDHRLHLVEEKSLTGLKPAMLFAHWKKEGTIVKTKNLLQVLENLGKSGNDIMSALAELNGMTRLGDASSLIERAKDEQMR